MKDAVCDILLNGDADFNHHGIPTSNLKDHAFKLKRFSNLIYILFGDVTREKYFGDISKQPPPLMYMDYTAFLSKTIVYRENNNNGTGGDDVVNLVTELSQNNNQNKCGDNYYYLVCMKKPNGVKRDGIVVAAHPTTTNRSTLTVLQQWIWYSTLEDTWAK